MKRLTLAQFCLGLSITILFLIVLHAPLTVLVGTQLPEIALGVKAWKEILLIVLTVAVALLITREKAWKSLAQDKLLWLIDAYVLLHLLSLMMWNGWYSAVAGLMIDLRYLLFFVLLYLLVKLYPAFRVPLLQTAVVGAFVVLGFFVLQLFLPYDFLKILGYGPDTIRAYITIDQNYDFIRYQSTMRGPNPFGAYTASVAIIAWAWLLYKRTVRQVRWLPFMFAVAVIATYFSHSRSAFIALAAGLGIVTLVRFYRHIKAWQWGVLVGFIVAFAVTGFLMRESSFVANVFLHENPESTTVEKSNDGHVKSLIDGTKRMAAQPLGAGIGSTGSASFEGRAPLVIENQYLFIAHEVGWLGLLLFLAIFIIIMHRLWMRRADPWALGLFGAGIGLALIGILLPVWADDTVSLVWWGLAGIVLASAKMKRRKDGQKYEKA